MIPALEVVDGLGYPPTPSLWRELARGAGGHGAQASPSHHRPLQGDNLWPRVSHLPWTLLVTPVVS